MEKILQITTDDKYNYLEIAKWGKFLSIVGFAGTGVLILVGMFFEAVMSMFPMPSGAELGFSGFGIFYVLMSLLYFVPSLFLFRYATKIKQAVKSEDQYLFSQAVVNLRRLFVFVGILTAIMLVIYGIAFIMIFTVGAAMGDMLYNT